MERENQRVLITKRMLKESLLKILNEKDLEVISVTELCRDAGVNRATFYRHYDIPRDLLKEIRQDMYCDLRRHVAMPQNAEDFPMTIEKLCMYINDHREMIRVLLQSSSDADFADFMNEVYLELAREYSHMEMLRKLSMEDIRLMTLYSTGGSYFVLRSWVMGSIQKTPKQMADYVANLLSKTEALLQTLAERKKA